MLLLSRAAAGWDEAGAQRYPSSATRTLTHACIHAFLRPVCLQLVEMKDEGGSELLQRKSYADIYR